MDKVRALSIHADYRCRHSGNCCSADWDVPVEVPVYRSLSDALARGGLEPSSAAAGLAPFIMGPDLPDDAAAMLERTDTGLCVFLEPTSRLCIVHRDLGHDRLPATCRHFPRVAIHDARGISVALSHFCPTAAAMLFRDDVDLTILDNPVSFPPADYEGLTITEDDLPPLLTPAMLMPISRITLDLLRIVLADRDDLEMVRLDPRVERVDRMRAFVEEHLTEADFDPPALIERFALSRATLYRDFEPWGGPAHYIRQRRLERLRDRLQDPNDPRALAELAAALGFSGENVASAAFVEAFGVRPGAYRRQAQGESDMARSRRRMGEWQSVLR